MKAIVVFIFGFFLISITGFSQKQLIVIKHGTVVARFAEGQYLRCVLKKKHRHTEGHILELNDFSMIASSDTIQFRDIERIDMRKQRGPVRWNSGVGGLLFVSGILYIGLDRLNSGIGVNTSPLDASVLNTSLIMTSVGAALIFIRPKYQRVNSNGFTLHTIDYNSPFYK